MFQILLLLFVSLITTACGPKFVDYFPYYDSGAVKPAVAFVPIQDSTDNQFAWSVSKELEKSIRYEAMNFGDLYFIPEEEMDQEKCNFLTPESDICKKYDTADFVVIPELEEYSYVPFHLAGTDSSAPPSTLLIKMRIRIVDVRRSRYPRTILQEVVTKSYTMPTGCEDLFGRNGNPPPYASSPVGKAHQRFAQFIASRFTEVMNSTR